MIALRKEEIGGKAARLIEMGEYGFPVKSCFCIDVEAVAGIIREQSVPDKLISNILSKITSNGSGFAVRSTAVGEDGEFSWAGIFKSELYVPEVDLSKAILSCANQQHGGEVQAYAASMNIEIPKLALFVQEMIDPFSAGVIFSRNPVGNLNSIMIEAVSGVGAVLVDGVKKPDRYYVDPDNLSLISKNCVDENSAKLTEDQIRSLTDLSVELSNVFEAPQDIEWAIDRDGNLFITQSRDITTEASGIDIEKIRQRVISEVREHLRNEESRLNFHGDVLSSQNVAEILTSCPCQMAFDLFCYLFAHNEGAIKQGRNELGYEIGNELQEGFQILVGGQPRCSIVHDAFTYRVQGIPLEDYYKIVEYYLEQVKDNHKLANYPEVFLYEQNPSFEFLNNIFGPIKAEMYLQAFSEFFQKFKEEEKDYDFICRDLLISQWRKEIFQLKSQAEKVSDLKEAVFLLRKTMDATKDKACKNFVKGTRMGFFAFARLRRLLMDLFGKEGEQAVNVLSTGSSPASNPNLLFEEKLLKLKNGEITLEDVIEEFGHLSDRELEISVARYHDNPEIIQRLVVNLSKDVDGCNSNNAQKSELLMQELASRLETEEAASLRTEVDLTRRYLSLRETLKFEFLRGYDVIRRLVVRIESFLDWPSGLIFNLKLEEVLELSQKDIQDLRQLALDRQKKREEEKTLFIPKVLDADNLDQIGLQSSSYSNIIQGDGATNIVTEGTAIVINSLDDHESISKIRPGMILVTSTTDPGWVPALSVLGSSGGLVTEIGGILAHGGVYAREKGIAAVLNVSDATKIIKTGDRIKVNGFQGYVEILN